MPGRRRTVPVVDQRADRDRTRGRIDARVDARDLAAERRARIRGAARLDGQARLECREEDFGDGEVELDDAQIVERRDHGPRIDEAAEADVAQADAAGERRRDDAILESRTRRFDTRFVGEHGRLQLLELRFGQRARLEQLLAALVLTSAVGRGGLCGGEIGTRLVVVEFDEHVALAHLLAFSEVNRGDAVGDLGGNVHGFVRTHRAERFNLLRERLAHRLTGNHGDRARARGWDRRVRFRAREPVPGASTQQHRCEERRNRDVCFESRSEQAFRRSPADQEVMEWKSIALMRSGWRLAVGG